MFGPPTYGPWHLWFAWKPVETDNHGVKWLCYVLRQRWYGGGTRGWDYTPLSQCTHEEIRCIHGDEINSVNGRRTRCETCEKPLEYPLPYICTVTREPHYGMREDINNGQ